MPGQQILTDTTPSRASPLPQLSGVGESTQAAEKRQPAETGCRFSGIAALPAPRKAPVYGGCSVWHGAC
ncbi:hypothetical protein C1894_26210 [Pseudomonas sp. FW305-3-2-15-E-TSA2]|nr:hypothetical protein C1895_18755 [Pseudomonas sp. FW305-3-2-15-E-TSA4]POA34683.1 hypothetical protein C1894_26210 [Pseudomonas sp. FW305-3-2-15-E-TSA2]